MPAKPRADQRLLISGTVEVIEEDLHGDPKLVELVSPELGRFRVAPDRSGRKLLKHVGNWVSVFGTVEMENGLRVLHVDGFRPLALFSETESPLAN
jgi:hypothetical protein